MICIEILKHVVNRFQNIDIVHDIVDNHRVDHTIIIYYYNLVDVTLKYIYIYDI